MTLAASAMIGMMIVSAPGPGAATDAGASAPLAADIAGKSANVAHWPSFCQIPQRPKNIRTGAAFKQAVVALRLAGVRLAAQSAPATFSLDDTEGFAGAARAQATPPPPITPPDEQQTETFINQARALARPPGPR